MELITAKSPYQTFVANLKNQKEDKEKKELGNKRQKALDLYVGLFYEKLKEKQLLQPQEISMGETTTCSSDSSISPQLSTPKLFSAVSSTAESERMDVVTTLQPQSPTSGTPTSTTFESNAPNVSFMLSPISPQSNNNNNNNIYFFETLFYLMNYKEL
jgi:hypothetical protein